jgi:hypothetical protein
VGISSRRFLASRHRLDCLGEGYITSKRSCTLGILGVRGTLWADSLEEPGVHPVHYWRTVMGDQKCTGYTVHKQSHKRQALTTPPPKVALRRATPRRARPPPASRAAPARFRVQGVGLRVQDLEFGV